MQLGLLPPPAQSIDVLESPALEQDDAVLAAALAIALQDEVLAESADDKDQDGAEDVEAEEMTPYPHIFVVGDAADAFGAIPAGHNAYYQGEVAARNVLRLIEGAGTPLEQYTPGVPAIKVSLGLVRCSLQLYFLGLTHILQKKNVYQVNGVVGVGKETRDDLNAASIWSYFGCPVEDEAEMYR
jgi:pyruvate/2-oxoglutarate dehydrogenase complex dihydrolipoamide dehydrogenase (E3) component